MKTQELNQVRFIAKEDTNLTLYLDPNSISFNVVCIKKGEDVIGQFIEEKTHSGEIAKVLGDKTTTIKLHNGYFVSINHSKFDFVSMEKSDREKAIEWWHNLELDKRNLIYMDYMGTLNSGRVLKQFEIEQIWRKETKQEKEGMSQVDFELLKTFKEDFTNLSNLNPVLKGGWIKESLENMYLFVELLSKSSTFAHKAHKELNKLMK